MYFSQVRKEETDIKSSKEIPMRGSTKCYLYKKEQPIMKQEEQNRELYNMMGTKKVDTKLISMARDIECQGHGKKKGETKIKISISAFKVY